MLKPSGRVSRVRRVAPSSSCSPVMQGSVTDTAEVAHTHPQVQPAGAVPIRGNAPTFELDPRQAVELDADDFFKLGELGA